MIHGLLWLPLLVVFFWLAWAGRSEFQKLEAYRIWAEPFDHAKYDIYSVLGQKGSDLTWGKPDRKTPQNLQTFSLKQVEEIQVVGDRPIDLDNPPAKARQVALAFKLPEAEIKIPFTELSLAIEWAKHLQQDWQNLRADVDTVNS